MRTNNSYYGRLIKEVDKEIANLLAFRKELEELKEENEERDRKSNKV